jgi:ribosome-associated protein
MAKSSKSHASPAALPDHIMTVVEAARAKKAVGLTVLDLRSAGAFADFFVICSGQTGRQVKAIVDAIEEALKKAGVRPSHIEGYERAEWILVDCFDFIVHVFTPQTRTFYSLERLWGEAVEINLSDEDTDAPSTATRPVEAPRAPRAKRVRRAPQS